MARLVEVLRVVSARVSSDEKVGSSRDVASRTTFCFGIDGLSASRMARSTRRRAIRWNLRVVRVGVEFVSIEMW